MYSILILFVTAVLASYENNLNYRLARGPPLPSDEETFVVEQQVFTGTQGLNFTHGVASGDPLHSSVILWTRIAPISGGYHDGLPICVNYDVFESRSMTNRVAKGTAFTSDDIDYTVKVDVTGLQSFTTYYYQFHTCDGAFSSPVGRTKTAPHPNDVVKQDIRLAVYSCANYRNVHPDLADH
jgi:alkaline phosphatase D